MEDLQEAATQLANLSLRDSDSITASSSSATHEKENDASARSAIDWTSVTETAQRCADSLRQENARDQAGHGPVIQACSDLLDASSKAIVAANPASHSQLLDAQTQLCRVVGNLVLDHPTNRGKCLALGIPQKILAILDSLTSTAHPTELSLLLAIKACTGALLNLSVDTPTIAKVLVRHSAWSVYARCLQSYQTSSSTPAASSSSASDSLTVQTTIAEWAIKAMAELASNDEAPPTAPLLAVARSILSLNGDEVGQELVDTSRQATYAMLEADLTILAGCAEILESQTYKSSSIQEAIAFEADTGAGSVQESAGSSILIEMFRFVETAQIPSSWKAVWQEDVQNGDSLEIAKTFANLKASIARTAIAVAGSDRVMHSAFAKQSPLSWLIPRCVEWLGSRRPDLVITSSTVLANLARQDSYCLALIHDYGIVSKLANLLAAYSKADSPEVVALSRPGEAIQILHGVTGLLKNLAIPGANKQPLCDAGLVSILALLLRPQLDMVLPLQNAAVGTLKHMCAGNVSSSLQLVLPPFSEGASSVVTVDGALGPSSSTPLSAVLSLIQRTNDVRLKCEATRLLGNVVRSLYSSRSMASPVTPAALNGLETGIAKGKARDTLESSEGAVGALSELLRTGEKYPSLVNEAMVALTLLSTTEPGAAMTARAVTRRHATQDPPPAASDSASRSDPPAPLESNKQVAQRSDSLMTRFAPATAFDIVLRWLNDYAIQKVTMPPELAGNALALVDGLTRSNAQDLPTAALRLSLQAVIRRTGTGPHELALAQTAQQILAKLP